MRSMRASAPRGSLENLSQAEIDKLLDTSHTGLYTLFRNCALAVLNSGSDSDNAKEIFERYRNFDVQIAAPRLGHQARDHQCAGRGIRRRRDDPAASRSTCSRCCATSSTPPTRSSAPARLDARDRASITNAVFTCCATRACSTTRRGRTWWCAGAATRSVTRVPLRQARRLRARAARRSMSAPAAGPGAMKAPMKGAGVGHAKQRITPGPLHRPHRARHHRRRAAERHRQSARDHAGHRKAARGVRAARRTASSCFPAASAPPRRSCTCSGCCSIRPTRAQPLPVVLTGPRASAGYFEQIARFIEGTLGAAGAHPAEGHHRRPGRLSRATWSARSSRCASSAARQNDSYNFNWLLRVPYELQLPFEVTHASMRALELHRAAAGASPGRQSAARVLRHRHRQRQGARRRGHRACMVRTSSRAIREIMRLLDELLTAFVAQRRMKLPGSAYRPCYRLVS